MKTAPPSANMEMAGGSGVADAELIETLPDCTATRENKNGAEIGLLLVFVMPPMLIV